MNIPRIGGYIDSITNEHIYGWAWDHQAPERRLEVEIFLGDRHLGTVTADLPRPDLRMNGIGDGRYAFQFPLNGHDVDPMEIRAVVRLTPDSEPIEVAKSANALNPELLDTAKALFRLIELFETLHSNQIAITRSVPASIGDLRAAVRQDVAADVVPTLAGLADTVGFGFSSVEKRLSDLEVFINRLDGTLRDIDQKADLLAHCGEDKILRTMVAIQLVLVIALVALAAAVFF